MTNYAGFQAGWFACVAGAGKGLFWLGPAAAVLLLGAHLAASPDPRGELRRVALVAAFGLLLEALALRLGLHAYAGGFLPAWVAALWLLFAATLGSSLAWLEGRPLLAAVLGAAAGPLSFRAGIGLGAGAFLGSPAAGSLVLSALWALALPGAYAVSRRFS
jgi:hypothetical protein